MSLVAGCTRRPYACFRTQPPEDSIRVNVPVTFYASCSVNSNEYFWEFYDNPDSSYFGYSIQHTFYTPGKQKVFLMVAGYGKTASTIREIEVKP
ncbi:MAG: hypothetical protein NZM35_01175 [Chitinophagales bacterium]|nr:hypothetical protein [Chitinophagales bacterium]MDW8418082.1 hypothetical protein [Chitinophagales bacterium]